VEPPAQADERGGGPVDVPNPIEQASPAAQRPGVGEVADRLLDQRSQPRLATVVNLLRVGEPILGAPVPDRRMPVLAELGQPPNPRSSRHATPVASSTWSSPDSRRSSCSWQLPGQPPSHHSRSPWMVDTATPWRCGRAAWRRRGPSGWPMTGVVAPWWRARRPGPPRRCGPSRSGGRQGRRGSPRTCRQAGTSRAQPAWGAAGPRCRPPRSWRSPLSERPAGTTAHPG
jgi:hypothetical protein